MNVNTSLHPTRARRAFKLGSIALALGLLQAPAWAVDYVWQSVPGISYWDDPNRWTLLGVPGIDDSATINNLGTTVAVVRDLRSVGTLFLNSGSNLSSTSTLTVGTLVFNGGTFGYSTTLGGGVMNVTGTTAFNGAGNQTLDYSHVINLGGNTTWSAGNGKLLVAQAYGNGTDNWPSAVLNIGAATTFSDQGAASAAGSKIIGGGSVNNYGTYVRTGLGETVARGFNNVGTLDIASGDFTFQNGYASNTSSGLIKVASGSTLTVSNLSVTGGSIVNNGLVRQSTGDVTVASAVQIGGAWQLDGGRLIIDGPHALDSLVINNGRLTGSAALTVGSLVFNYGWIGGDSGTQGGGVVKVAGPAVFNGLNTTTVDYNSTLTLAGDARWTAGNGWLSVIASGSGPYATFNIGKGTTFTDEGAASAAGSKTLGGGGGGDSGNVNNMGTYVRTGLGETYARGFNNLGTLKIASGTMTVAPLLFVSTGQIEVAAGARLQADRGQLNISGGLNGTGVIKTFSADYAVLSSGTINPGSAANSGAPNGTAERGTAERMSNATVGDAGLGTLTIDGDLTLTDTSVLHIDLASAGASDKLAVTSDVLWNGELSLWANAGTLLQVGDVYTIASYGQRLSSSTFDSISWHGLSADQFSVEYNADSITLRVTAVPEPGSAVLLLAGALAVGAVMRRRAVQA